MASPRLKPLILLCDGTWCGRETSTQTNIYLLADMIGIPIASSTDTDEHLLSDGPQGRKGRYIHGVGLGSTFLDYVFNGITASDIADQCIGAYRYIVDNYDPGQYEIWMFGLSRGAYIVRCVAGMVNNCGIINKMKAALSNNDLDLLCREVYRIYRSDYEVDSPKSNQSKAFRKRVSWPQIGDDDDDDDEPMRDGSNLQNDLKPPIRFMGLFDTVGSLGIPTFTGGVGLNWPSFYNQNVSSVVSDVYHATSLHDRLYIFQPCLARRDTQNPKFKDRQDWKITEKWFPGVHYDLGRQRFKFFRDAGGAGLLERLLATMGWASKVIEPNHVLADLALKWMLECIDKHDKTPEGQPAGLVIPDIRARIRNLQNAIVSDDRKIGDGDIYNRVLEYAPFGRWGMMIWRTVAGSRGKVNAIYEILFALRDRHIPDDDADVSRYTIADPLLLNGDSVAELAGIDVLSGNKEHDEKKRYPSRAYDSWVLRTSL